MASSEAGASAAKKESTAVINVRTDLGDVAADAFAIAQNTAMKHADDADAVDKLGPVTKMYTDMLRAVPEDKLMSAGYAELLFAYGQVLFVFAKKSIYQTAILGGDVEAAALKSALEDRLRSNGIRTTRKKGGPSNAGASSKDAVADEEEKDAVETNVDDGNAAETDAKATGVDDKNAVASKTTTKSADIENATAEKAETVAGEVDSKQKVVLSDGKEEPEIAKKEEVNGTDGGKEPAEGDEIDGDDVGSDEEGENDDVDNETLTWEQYEYARTIFEALGEAQRHRLPDVYEALGNLMLECEQRKGAADEYEKGLKVLATLPINDDRQRATSHLLYQRFIALRREAPHDALAALGEAVAIYENATGSDDFRIETLEMLRDELRAFREALPTDALAVLSSKEAKRPAAEETVTGVQPRRKVRKVVQLDDDDDDDDDETPAAENVLANEVKPAS